jgi:hypothetical protein
VIRILTLAISALIWVTVFQAAGAAVSEQVATEAMKEFAWFDSLGFPDVAHKTLGKIPTGQYRDYKGQWQTQFIKAFILSTNEQRFSILTLNLEKLEWTNNPTGTTLEPKLGFEQLSVRREAEAMVKEFGASTGDEGSERWPPTFGQPRYVTAFVLSWACWREGLKDDAIKMFAASKAAAQRRMRQKEVSSFQNQIEKDLGESLMWRTILKFEDLSVSRSELLNDLRTVARNYPHFKMTDREKAMPAILEKMIVEDAAVAARPPLDLKNLSKEERIRELIFRLRDQNGRQVSQPGECNIFYSQDGRTDTPAHQLVQLGPGAVPQLIEALDDPELSRSVGYHRDFYFSHVVLTVGDCALAILEKIAKKEFFDRKNTSSYMSKDDGVKEAREAAEKWWSEVTARQN